MKLSKKHLLYLKLKFHIFLGTYRVRTTADSWHYEACEAIACKEFCKPDGCRPDEVHLKYCFGCFQATMAIRERALHVRDL